MTNAGEGSRNDAGTLLECLVDAYLKTRRGRRICDCSIQCNCPPLRNGGQSGPACDKSYLILDIGICTSILKRQAPESSATCPLGEDSLLRLSSTRHDLHTDDCLLVSKRLLFSTRSA